MTHFDQPIATSCRFGKPSMLAAGAIPKETSTENRSLRASTSRRRPQDGLVLAAGPLCAEGQEVPLVVT